MGRPEFRVWRRRAMAKMATPMSAAPAAPTPTPIPALTGVERFAAAVDDASLLPAVPAWLVDVVAGVLFGAP